MSHSWEEFESRVKSEISLTPAHVFIGIKDTVRTGWVFKKTVWVIAVAVGGGKFDSVVKIFDVFGRVTGITKTSGMEVGKNIPGRQHVRDPSLGYTWGTDLKSTYQKFISNNYIPMEYTGELICGEDTFSVVRGIRHGDYIKRWNGVIVEKASYKHSLLDGTLTSFDRSSLLVRRIVYQKGIPVTSPTLAIRCLQEGDEDGFITAAGIESIESVSSRRCDLCSKEITGRMIRCPNKNEKDCCGWSGSRYCLPCVMSRAQTTNQVRESFCVVCNTSLWKV